MHVTDAKDYLRQYAIEGGWKATVIERKDRITDAPTVDPKGGCQQWRALDHPIPHYLWSKEPHLKANREWKLLERILPPAQRLGLPVPFAPAV